MGENISHRKDSIVCFAAVILDSGRFMYLKRELRVRHSVPKVPSLHNVLFNSTAAVVAACSAFTVVNENCSNCQCYT